MKKIFLLVVTAVMTIFFITLSPVFASDSPVKLIYQKSGSNISMGKGFFRERDLWIPESALKIMEITYSVSNDGKSFVLNVPFPAGKLGLPALTFLAGNNLSLNFPLLQEGETNYFCIENSLAAVTDVKIKRQGSTVYFVPYTMNDMMTEGTYMPKQVCSPITLVWDYVSKTNHDIDGFGKMRGVNAIAPTWFNLTDENGCMANRASAAYVKHAHDRGLVVWPVFTNGFSGPKTSAFFRNPGAMRKYIARILAYSVLYDLDGVNIDFENVNVNDRDLFTRFISLLYGYTRQMGLKLSVDVHVPSNSNISKSHDRGALAEYVDYIMLMAYDEHWRTCRVAGSVASMPWVERAVSNALKEGVPCEKLILGVPFYMRRWEETPIKKGVRVKARTYTMEESNNTIRSLSLRPKWDNRVGQHYYSFKKNGKTYKVWVEDKKSLQLKASLVYKYGLNGIAGWRIGHNTPDIFPLLKKK